MIIEAGPAGISFVVENEDNEVSALVSYAFPLDMDTDSVASAMNESIKKEPFLQLQFKKTAIIWAFPEALLVPDEWMSSATAGDMLELLYGDLHRGEVKSDFMSRRNLHTVYRIPEPVAEVFAKHFPFASQTHQYAVLAELFPDCTNQLYVIFYNNRLTAMLHKENKLQAIQSFPYQNPEDVSYHLLDLCRSFDVAPASIVLKYCGMIEEKSNLYAELYKYFLTLEPAKLPPDTPVSEAINKYPSHFFSHLSAIALCVS